MEEAKGLDKALSQHWEAVGFKKGEAAAFARIEAVVDGVACEVKSISIHKLKNEYVIAGNRLTSGASLREALEKAEEEDKE